MLQGASTSHGDVQEETQECHGIRNKDPPESISDGTLYMLQNQKLMAKEERVLEEKRKKLKFAEARKHLGDDLDNSDGTLCMCCRTRS